MCVWLYLALSANRVDLCPAFRLNPIIVNAPAKKGSQRLNSICEELCQPQETTSLHPGKWASRPVLEMI